MYVTHQTQKNKLTQLVHNVTSHVNMYVSVCGDIHGLRTSRHVSKTYKFFIVGEYHVIHTYVTSVRTCNVYRVTVRFYHVPFRGR